MTIERDLIRKIAEEESRVKPLLQDADGRFYVNPELRDKEDKRNLMAYTLGCLKGLSVLQKIQSSDCVAFGYTVILRGFGFTEGDKKAISNRLKNKAQITSNLSHSNRDVNEIVIEYKQSFLKKF